MKASNLIDYLYKMAGYMKSTKCEQCGYEGKLNSDDGRCPSCGSLSGIKATDTSVEKRDESLYNKDMCLGKLYDDINKARQELYGGGYM